MMNYITSKRESEKKHEHREEEDRCKRRHVDEIVRILIVDGNLRCEKKRGWSMIEKDYIFVKKNGKDEGGSTNEEEEIVKGCSERKRQERERERDTKVLLFYI